MTTPQTLRTLDREQVAQVWFRSAAGTVEVSLDGGQTWATLLSGTDGDGNTAQYLLLAGPDVAEDEVDPDAVILAQGRHHGISRVVDQPRITPHRWTIDVPRSSSGTVTSGSAAPILVIDGGNAE